MKKVLVVLILMIASFIGGFICHYYYDANHGDSYDAAIIEKNLTDIAELATLQCDYTEQSTFKGEPKTIFGKNIPFTSKAMQIRYSGTVKFGPDMSAAEMDLNEEAKTLTVKIPHSTILSHEIDEDSLEVVYIDNGLFNSVTPEDTNKLRKEAKAEKEKSLADTDFYQQADTKAQEQITKFLQAAYPDLTVTVEFKSQ